MTTTTTTTTTSTTKESEDPQPQPPPSASSSLSSENEEEKKMMMKNPSFDYDCVDNSRSNNNNDRKKKIRKVRCSCRMTNEEPPDLVPRIDDDYDEVDEPDDENDNENGAVDVVVDANDDGTSHVVVTDDDDDDDDDINNSDGENDDDDDSRRSLSNNDTSLPNDEILEENKKKEEDLKEEEVPGIEVGDLDDQEDNDIVVQHLVEEKRHIERQDDDDDDDDDSSYSTHPSLPSLGDRLPYNNNDESNDDEEEEEVGDDFETQYLPPSSRQDCSSFEDLSITSSEVDLIFGDVSIASSGEKATDGSNGRTTKNYNDKTGAATDHGETSNLVVIGGKAELVNSEVDAITLLQSQVRRFISTRRFHRCRTAAVRLQALRRKSELRRRFLNYRAASTTLQSWKRKVIAQQQWLKVRSATIQLQAKIRQLSVQRQWSRTLEERIAAMHRFRRIWTRVLKILPQLQSSATNAMDDPNECLWGATESSWEEIKARRLDIMGMQIEVSKSDKATSPTAYMSTNRLDPTILNAIELSKQKHDRGVEGSISDVVHARNQATVITKSSVVKSPQVTPTKMKPLHPPTGLSPVGSVQSPGSQPRPKCDHIQLTKDVLRWLDRQDPKYRRIFAKRVRQLADGERSRTLRKNLIGGGIRSTIWETYLDQKSGQRILWTEVDQESTSTEQGLLIWYVAKHDYVSRLIALIDDSHRRCVQRLTTSAATLFMGEEDHKSQGAEPTEHEATHNGLAFCHKHRVLADPIRDRPLQLHIMHRDDLFKLEIPSWKPPLYLTREERAHVEKMGSVLLLGRSGTGKTICLCNRMDFDRRHNDHCYMVGQKFRQLFVARSRNICSYVRGVVDGDSASTGDTTYSTFNKLLDWINSSLSSSTLSGTLGEHYDRAQRVDFRRFKLELFKPEFGLDALIIWSQIRSFIKGSIEAVMAGRSLTKAQYLKLGGNRCRLSNEQRELAYDAFQRYQQSLDTAGLWDDCDRVSMVLGKILSADRESLQKISFNKIYVDEVQDFVQAEIAIFFLLCDRGGLFLTGDTAQSVVEGVEFRFEEVRSVAHSLFGGDHRYIPEKPVTLVTNFRSHAGILNMASSILERMFSAFPRSADKLNPDVGVFGGPRPGIFYNLSFQGLQELVARVEGAVLLTHKRLVASFEAVVGDAAIVLSIAESKGLEFPNVIVVDFFKELANEHQKPWREVLREKSDYFSIKDDVPEVETQMKKLYVAITRCSKRLFFVETEESVAGNAFVKWATKVKKEARGKAIGLAISQAIDNVEKETKTSDEWRLSGVEAAIKSEVASAETARKWMVRAINDFERAGNETELKRKAEVHLSSVDFRVELEIVYRKLQAETNKELLAALLDEIEQKGSNILVGLLVEGLRKEARNMCDILVPMLGSYSKQRLTREVLPFLPPAED